MMDPEGNGHVAPRGDHPRPGRSRRPSTRSFRRSLHSATCRRVPTMRRIGCGMPTRCCSARRRWATGRSSCWARRFLLVGEPRARRPRHGRRPALAFRLRATRARHPLYEWYGPLWKAIRALLEGRFSEVDAANAEAATMANRRAARTRSCSATPSAGAGSPRPVIGSGSKRWPPASRTPRSTPRGSRWCGRSSPASSGTSRTHAAHWARIAPRLASLPHDSEWLAVMAQVAEVITIIGTHRVGAWVFDALLPYANLFAVEGIGATVRGPLHRHLGLHDRVCGAPTMLGSTSKTAPGRRVGTQQATQLTARIEAEAAATALVAAIDTEQAERVPSRRRTLGAAVRRAAR